MMYKLTLPIRAAKQITQRIVVSETVASRPNNILKFHESESNDEICFVAKQQNFGRSSSLADTRKQNPKTKTNELKM